MLNRITIKSFDEYIETICKLKEKDNSLWFRGQKNSELNLLPKILRESYPIIDSRGYEIKESNKNVAMLGSSYTSLSRSALNLVEQFKEKYEEFGIKDFIKPKNTMEWMVLGQHYGLPTPLLDWTTDPLVGLFFAVDQIDKFNLDASASVWILNPKEVNGIILGEEYKGKELPDTESDYEFIINAYKKVQALCFLGNKKNPRICRQSGNFTIIGSTWRNPLDYYQVIRNEITVIDIHYKFIKDIKIKLEALNITNESIYLNESLLDGISETIDKNSKKNLREYITKFYTSD